MKAGGREGEESIQPFVSTELRSQVGQEFFFFFFSEIFSGTA